MKFKLTTLFTLTIAVLIWFVMNNNEAVNTPHSEQTIAAKHWQQHGSVNKRNTDQSITLNNTNTHRLNNSFNPSFNESPIATSLNGSSPDGAVNINNYGDIQLDKDLHRLFDYYLSMTGEQSINSIRAQILNTAHKALTDDQLAQLQHHFDRYIDYLRTAESYVTTDLDGINSLEYIDAISELRRQLLGDDMADAFFAEEEAYARHTIQMRLTGASNADQEQQIKWLNTQDQATAYHDVLIENQQFNDTQANASERMTIRTENYGKAVAQQLAILDHNQQQWQSTVNHYIENRSRLQNTPTALNQFEQSYAPTELKRLQAYYRAHLQKKASF